MRGLPTHRPLTRTKLLYSQRFDRVRWFDGQQRDHDAQETSPVNSQLLLLLSSGDGLLDAGPCNKHDQKLHRSHRPLQPSVVALTISKSLGPPPFWRSTNKALSAPPPLVPKVSQRSTSR